VALAVGLAVAGGAEPARKSFHIRVGDAAVTLVEFARQSGEQIVYLVENVRGQQTSPVEGEWSAREALERMLAGTNLTVLRDAASGAMTVSRRSEPWRPATSTPERMPPPGPPGDALVVLPQFTVSTEAADRYRSADAVSAVRVRAPLLDTPASITVLTRDIIDDLEPTRIFDVTRYVAGVQDGRGIQFQDRMILRGFESNGQRTVDNFLQPADADNIDEAVIDRIEVAKGPNAILSPAGAPGGAINVITKSPLFTPQRSLTAVAGLFDAQKLTLDLTGPIAPGSAMAYRLVGAWQDSRRYWANDARLRGRVFAPMFSWRIADHTLFTAKLVAAEHWVFRDPLLILDPAVNAAADDPSLAPGVSARSLNGIQPWSHVGTRTADLFALLTSNLNDHLSLRVAANGRYYYEDSTQEFVTTPGLSNRYNPFTGELTQDYTWAPDPATGAYVAAYAPLFNPAAIPVRGDTQATRRKTGSLQADLVAKYRFGEISSQTVGGIALSRQTGYSRLRTGTLPPIDLRRPGMRADPVWAPDFYQSTIGSFTNWQAYVNQRLGFFGDRVLLTGGVLRYDTHTISRNVLANAAASVLDDGKNMWQASLLLKLRPNVSLYYSHSTNSSPVIANDLPLWRDGRQDEFGLKSEFINQRLSISAAWFKISQTNVSVPNPARQTDLSAPEQLISDLGDHGVEFELQGALTPSLSAIATYSRLRLRDSLGRPVRAVADDNAALLLNYRFNAGAGQGLALTLGASYTGRRAGDTPVNFTPLGVPGQVSFFLKPSYVTVLGAAYRWGERYVFRLNLDNVFDDAGYIQQAGARVSGTGISTAPGRNVKLSATVKF